MTTYVNCRVCNATLLPREIAAGYGGKCEDCWSGHKSDPLDPTSFSAAEAHGGGRGRVDESRVAIPAGKKYLPARGGARLIKTKQDPKGDGGDNSIK